MKRIFQNVLTWQILSLLFFSLLLHVTRSFSEPLSAPSPVGYWQTIDDVTQKPKAIIHISENSDHKLFGKILKIFPRPGQDQNELCTACANEKHNQPIVGMVFLENLMRQADKQNIWSNGTILDPKNGRTYKCMVQLIDHGKTLRVRGYIGLPLLGRTQTWVRVASNS